MRYTRIFIEDDGNFFALFQDFMDATSDVWKVVEECRTAVEGAWSEPRRVFQHMGQTKGSSGKWP